VKNLARILVLCGVIGLGVFGSLALFASCSSAEAAERSSRWAAVRRAHLEIEPYCAVCGSEEDLEVHHIKPFHSNPDLELAPSNLITLCGGNCHWAVGHLGASWRAENPEIREMYQNAGARIRAMRMAWRAAQTNEAHP